MSTLRDMAPGDLEEILALNNAHAAEVNALALSELTDLVARAVRARVLDDRSAFLIAFDDTTPAQGPNHGWFLARGVPFLYIDRVVVAPAGRGRGLARMLYADLATIAAGRPLCCEVTVEPPAVASLAFHERLGFVSCGEAIDPRNGKRVRYLERPTHGAPSL